MDTPGEPTTLTNSIGAVSNAQEVQKTSILQLRLNEHGEQLNKLAVLIYGLTERLQPLIPSYPHDTSEGVKADDPPSSSQVISQLSDHTKTVMLIQHIVSQLLNDLEV